MDMQSRNQLVDSIAAFAGGAGIGAIYSVGDDATEMSDVRLLCVAKDPAGTVLAYKKLNYFIKNELSPAADSFISKDTTNIIKKYEMADGFTVTVTVPEPQNISVTGWWRAVLDDAAVSAAFDAAKKTDEDIIAAEKPAEEPAPAEPVEAAPVVEEQPAPVIEPIESPAAEAQPEDSGDEYWDFVAKNIRTARHAINSGSSIRAGEIISLLRHMLIELICVRNGIEGNFEHAIDSIECEETEMLVKTYPATMDRPGLINALSVISELFDRLA